MFTVVKVIPVPRDTRSSPSIRQSEAETLTATTNISIFNSSAIQMYYSTTFSPANPDPDKWADLPPVRGAVRKSKQTADIGEMPRGESFRSVLAVGCSEWWWSGVVVC